jgi:hypothetical protein
LKDKNSIVLAAQAPHLRKGLQKSEQGSAVWSSSSGNSASLSQQSVLHSINWSGEAEENAG